ncbi:MAG: DUF3343 domain-containing protein [Ruminococcaceae bacterium]|nr:DUF3343 domain-containing protein [Oscillospiraceae bacterium]
MLARDCYIITAEQAQNKASLIVRLLSKNGIEGQITSTPKEYTGKACAYSVRIAASSAVQAEDIIRRSNIKAQLFCK